MNERAIIFSQPMVRAILDGRKSQTRRLVRGKALEWLQPNMFSADFVALEQHRVCPYGYPGERLWVREAHYRSPEGRLAYRADAHEPAALPWQRSIFMRREHSRIELEITGLRIERLQDLSDEDATAEGAEYWVAFREVWRKIHGAQSWKQNPWVWVIVFTRVKP